MPSPNGAMKSRSATNYAGVGAIEHIAVSVNQAGVVVVKAPADTAAGMRLKVVSLNLTPSSDAADFQLVSKGATNTALTGIMGGLAGIPVTLPLDIPFGYATTKANESLAVSSVIGIAGTIVVKQIY
jgi:hypothetical protein